VRLLTPNLGKSAHKDRQAFRASLWPYCIRLRNLVVSPSNVKSLACRAGNWRRIAPEDRRYLIINEPGHTDVIVVLAGDQNDRRFFRGLQGGPAAAADVEEEVSSGPEPEFLHHKHGSLAT
jgi:hypothetical protein